MKAICGISICWVLLHHMNACICFSASFLQCRKRCLGKSIQLQ